MNLYNLYQSIILEEIIKLVQLNEAVSSNDVDGVLNGDPEKQGKFYHVSFNYKDNDGNVSNRWVQLYQRNISTANNGLVDAFQVSRDGKSSGLNTRTGKEESFTGWRKFRLDRMSNLKVSKVPFYQPQNGFNKTGNNSSTVSSTQKIAPVGSYQYAASTVKQKASAEKKQPVTQPVAQPVQQKPATQQQKPLVQKPVVQKPIKQNIQQPEMDNDLENKDELNK
jgi:hypothetical protein